jgi:signal transduction histidine kinase
MGGMGMTSNSANQETPTQSAEQIFLNRTNSYLWIAGLMAIAVALLLGILLTRQITRPIRDLTTGAQHIADGDLNYRAKVNSQDELGKLARSFNSMAVKLNNSEQSRRRLVSDVAHELRTPLTIIEGTVDGILDGVFLPDQEHLESIKEQTALLTHLVKDLSELSLAESGQLKLEILPTDIVDMVNRKCSQFEVSAKVKKIQIKLEASTDIPEVQADLKRIEQVIANLLSNAIRHTPENGQITVSIKKVDLGSPAGKPSITISVADTGEGIDTEHLPHIFERFYRVESSRSRSEGGVGLGLAIVKQMVQAHGGQVLVESQPGKGSTFTVILPLGGPNF